MLNLNNVKLLLSVGNIRQLPKNGLPEIVISGKSNVGKSSLINCLLNRKNLARTSATPGKTITINYYELDQKIHLVDLPGYGYAKRSKEMQQRFSGLIDEYLHTSPHIKLMIQLLDIRHKPTAEDRMMVEWILSFGHPMAVFCTKSDKLSKTAARENLQMIREELGLPDEVSVTPFSAVSREGRAELIAAISQAAGV